MSRLTPTNPLRDEQIEAALDILASGQITYAQLSKLVASLTIDEEQAGWGIDLQDLACTFEQDQKSWHDSLPEQEIPNAPLTIGRADQPSFVREVAA